MGAVVCLILTAAVYGPSLTTGFVYEDTRGPGIRPSEWTWGSRVVTRSVDRARTSLFGYGPLPAKALSLALHLVNGVLVGWLARAVLPAGAAVVAMGLFLLHPLNTEAVAYAAIQSELLMALCVLLALVAATNGQPVLAWLCCALAVGCKESGLVAFLLVPFWMASVRHGWRWSTVGWWSALSLLPALWAWPLLASHGYRWPSPDDLGVTFTMAGAVLTKWLWPVNLTIAYDWWLLTEPSRVFGAVSLWGLALAVGLCWRPVGLVLAFALLSLAPRLLWVLPDGIHEHHAYAATFAFAVGSAALLSRGFHGLRASV